MSLKRDAFFVMRGYVGVQEPRGNNDGDQINKAQRLMGLSEGSATHKGDPYCAAIIWCAVAVAYAKAHGIDPTNEHLLKTSVYPTMRAILPVSASVRAIKGQAEEMGTWVPFKPSYMASRGDLILFKFKSGNHVGMVDTDDGQGRVLTIEGNTSFEEGRNEETNDPKGGVWNKTRHKNEGNIWGYVKMP